MEEANRVGLRLEGTALPEGAHGEMISEGVSLGAVQIAAGGLPIILFVEQQTTGGDAKIANVISADFHSLGQLRARDESRFEQVELERARALLGYADRANFGRLGLKLPPKEIVNSVFEQVRALAEVAERCGARVVHVKPHGALYNQAVRNRDLAAAIAEGVARWSRDVVLVGLAGSPMLEVFREAGFAVGAEAFADRRYEPDGTFRSRKFQDALIRNTAEAAWQAGGIAWGGGGSVTV